MIKKCEDIQALLGALDKEPWYNLYARGYLAGYPRDDAFYRAFTLDGGAAVYSGGTLHLCAPAGYDPAEVAAFIRTLNASEVFAPADYRLDALLAGFECKDKELLVFAGTAPGKPGAVIAGENELNGVFSLLSRTFRNIGSLEEFLQAKTAQRFYLGGETAVVTDGGETAATASVLLRAGETALLGGVATDPAFRGHGYAGAVLSLLINRLLDRGITPAIMCDNPAAIRLYKSLGFEEYGKMTVYENVLQQ